jgi:hypothetical protein
MELHNDSQDSLVTVSLATSYLLASRDVILCRHHSSSSSLQLQLFWRKFTLTCTRKQLLE